MATRPPHSGAADGGAEAARVSVIRDYHERTQHRFERYARALGYLDWDTQPDPFRRYAGAVRVPLTLRPPDGAVRYADLFARKVHAAPCDAAAVAQLFEDSLALSAWKEHRGHRWSLRVNPSSGNLHPTEGYLLCGAVAGLCEAPGLFHYAPEDHALERRADLPVELWQRIARMLPADALLVGLSTIPWRESWKYGERALRYCMQDLGHALGSIGFAAAALGWRAELLPVTDAALAELLGIAEQQGPEAEQPCALLCVHRSSGDHAFARTFTLDPATLSALRKLPKPGVPAPLSADHHDWPVIDEAVAATRCTGAVPLSFWDRPATSTVALLPVPDGCARTLFRQRRSAVAMDGKTGTTAEVFAGMLARCCDPQSPPLQMLGWRSRVHLLLFVHRVEGLVPGLYCLVRGGRDPDWLRSRTRKEFLWERAKGVAASLPLFLLVPVDSRQAAKGASCQQDIAADSAFAVAMLAEMAGALDDFGAWGWRLVHWEAGAIGQLLYLEAEAAGLRATGIGCFFDPAVHEMLALQNDDLRTIYHFTTGGPVEDERLRTGPPYPGRP